MLRTLIGAAIGGVIGLLVVPIWGAHDGFVYGSEMRRLPPGLDAALNEALTYLFYLFWVGCLLGGFIGGLIGFVSWVVYPGRPASQASRFRRLKPSISSR